MYMVTLDSPVYEVNPDSQWYQDKKQQREDIETFFKTIRERFGMGDGFSFYHKEYFGIHGNTKDYEKFKDELLKNPTEKNDFYPFKKRSVFYKEINELLKKVKEVYPFKPHDELGLNNVSASQWIGDRWFFQVKDTTMVKGNDVIPVIYKEYLQLVMDRLDEEAEDE